MWSSTIQDWPTAATVPILEGVNPSGLFMAGLGIYILFNHELCEVNPLSSYFKQSVWIR